MEGDRKNVGIWGAKGYATKTGAFCRTLSRDYRPISRASHILNMRCRITPENKFGSHRPRNSKLTGMISN